MCRFVKFGVLAVLFTVASASAQIIKLEGGTSTLFNADGGTLTLKAPNYDSSIGAGIFQGHFQYGAVVRTKVLGYTVTAGDDSVRFDLPTDVFESTSYFSSRGFGVSKESDDSGFYAFGGLTSQWLGTSFFRAARSEEPVGVFFFHHRLSDSLQFFSRDIFTNKYTALQGLEWRPQKWLKTSATAGVGSDKPYFALAADAEIRNWALKGSYVAVNPDFRRIVVPDLTNSEPERENLQVTYRFSRDVSITASHRNLLQPLTLDSPLSRASMNQITSNFRIGSSYFGTGLFNSQFQNSRAWGASFYGGEKFRFLDASANYFVSKATSQQFQSLLTGTFREILSPRFNLLQVVNYSDGQTSLSYGGEFITNRFNVSVGYQTVYLPFRVAKQFQQTLSFNASVHVLGPLALNASSSVSPDGHTRYSIGGTTYFYRYAGLLPSWGQSQDTYRFPKYVVRGIVRDQEGRPVAGAAVQLNDDMIFTDGDGRFLYRSRKHRQMSFAVVPSQFLVTGFFQVVQAPSSVTTEEEDRAQEVIVIVRRLTPQQANLTPIAKAEYRQFEPKVPAHE